MKADEFSFADAISALPPRDRQGNKGTFGMLTAVCGSSQYRGAAVLAVEAALRCGAGIVQLASPECVISACAAQIRECIYLPLPECPEDLFPDEATLSKLCAASKRSTALLAGCGMGCGSGTRAVVETLSFIEDLPVLLDADALNCMQKDPSPLERLRGRAVITPHIGEFARLTGTPIPEIKASPAKSALEFARRFGCVVVLKDYITFIALPDGLILQTGSPNSGLAKGGSGDVLAGIIASLLAQGTKPGLAAAAGCAIHSEAARRCANALSERAMLPSDIIKALPDIFADGN